MSEPIVMEDRGDGFQLYYDPATFENFYVSAGGVDDAASFREVCLRMRGDGR
jgi:hypothetical protein